MAKIFIASRNDIRFFRWRLIHWRSVDGHSGWNLTRLAELGSCPAHGRINCRSCSRNNGLPQCNKCGYFDVYGVHWDTCANRVRS